MSYSVHVETLDKIKRKVRVTIEATKVGEMYDRIAADLVRNIRLPGFRPGKAPKDMVLQRYGDAIAAETASKLIDQVSEGALGQSKLQVVGVTQIAPEALKRDTPFSFDMTVEVRPEIKLKKYKKLKAVKPKFEAENAEIDRRLEQMRQERAELEPLIAPRPAKAGDIAIVDYSASADGGQPEQNEAYKVEIGMAHLHPDFDAALMGMEPGQSKTFDVQFADEDPREHLRGSVVTFSVTLQDLKQKVVPNLDDAFAKLVDGSATLLELRMKIRQAMEHSAQHEIDKWVEQEVLGQLITENPFDLPETVVKRIQENKAHRAVHDLEHRGYDVKKIQKEHIANLAETFRPAAERDARAMFLLDQIGKEENITVSDAELDERVKQIAAQLQMPEAQVRAQLGKEGGLDNLRDEMRNEKVLRLVIDQAKVDVIEMKEWRKILDERAAQQRAASAPTEEPAA